MSKAGPADPISHSVFQFMTIQAPPMASEKNPDVGYHSLLFID